MSLTGCAPLVAPEVGVLLGLLVGPGRPVEALQVLRTARPQNTVTSHSTSLLGVALSCLHCTWYTQSTRAPFLDTAGQCARLPQSLSMPAAHMWHVRSGLQAHRGRTMALFSCCRTSSYKRPAWRMRGSQLHADLAAKVVEDAGRRRQAGQQRVAAQARLGQVLAGDAHRAVRRRQCQHG